MVEEQAGYRIREIRDGDAGVVLAAFRSAPDMARQGDVTDEASAQRYVAWLREGARRGYAVTWSDEAEEVVGLVGATLDEANRSAWVFYWMHAEHRSAGVSARAVATVADHLLSTGVERLELGHRVNNPASGGVARAAGFVVEGRERGKFLIDGERVDVLTYGRVLGDPWPTVQRLPLG